MKKLYLFAIATLLTLQSCTVMKDVTTTNREASYSVSLNKVELPSNSKERFSETIQKDNSDGSVTKYVFEDEKIKIFWMVFNDQFAFTIYNKSDHAIKISWDDAVYVGVDKNISKMIHSGIKYIQRNDGQVATTIPKGAKLDDILVPVDHIKYYEYLGWRTSSLFPHSFSTDDEMQKAEKLEGETVSILLPIMIEGIQNDYTFTFKIDNVTTESKTTTSQVHDTDAEMWSIIGWSVGLCVGVPVIILLMVL